MEGLGIFFGFLFLLGVTIAIISGISTQIGSERRQRRLHTRGETAPAKILHLEDAGGGSDSGHPLIRLKVEVMPKGRPPFEATFETLVSRLISPMIVYAPGTVIPVRFDPESIPVGYDPFSEGPDIMLDATSPGYVPTKPGSGDLVIGILALIIYGGMVLIGIAVFIMRN
jgi:hypothetical protein